MNTFLNTIRNHWFIVTAICLAMITTLSLYPLEQLPPVPGSDKTHHFIAYAGLVFPVALRKPSHWLYLCVCFIAWSGAIEIIQPYVNRYGEWLDMAANCTGIACGICLAYGLNTLYPRKSP